MMKSRTLGILISILFCSLGVAPGSPARSSEINRPTSQPYTGNLSTFENAKRAKNLQIDRVMDLLGIQAGSAVADIGAGGGWFSVRAARRVGPRGIVYAEDINPPYVKEIMARARREKLPNIRAILGNPDDPQLPAMRVNAVLFLKAYHEIAHPIVLLRHVRAALRPEGRLGIIDRTGNGANHGVDPNDVMQELQRAGFFFVAKYDFVKADGEDYFLIFR